MDTGGIPTPKMLTSENILENSGILIKVPISSPGISSSPTISPTIIASRYGNRFPYRATISRNFESFLFSWYLSEKLIRSKSPTPATIAIGYLCILPPSPICPAITVIGAASRIPPFTDAGTAWTNLSASFEIPINKKTSPTSSCSAIIAWIRSCPIGNPSRKTIVNGSVGVIHPGTTGSPSRL